MPFVLVNVLAQLQHANLRAVSECINTGARQAVSSSLLVYAEIDAFVLS